MGWFISIDSFLWFPWPAPWQTRLYHLVLNIVDTGFFRSTHTHVRKAYRGAQTRHRKKKGILQLPQFYSLDLLFIPKVIDNNCDMDSLKNEYLQQGTK